MTHHRAPLTALAFLLAVLPVPCLSADAASVWVLEPVNVIDLETGEVHAGRSVQVDGGRILAVAAADAQAPAGARRIDGGGGWLMPGLAEMHAHVPSMDGGEGRVFDVLDLFLANGVTTIRGMLGEAGHLALRERLARGEIEGPRLVTSGPSFNGRSVTSPQQGAQRVREQFEAGYDFLKIHPGLERAEFLAIAAAARELGIPFAGHVSFATGLDVALAAGQATIDHLDGYAEAMLPADSPLVGEAPRFFGLNLGLAMDPALAGELARRTAAAGVWVVPTQSLFETTTGTLSIEELLARPGMELLSPALSRQWQDAVRDIREQSTPEARQAFLEARRALIFELQQAGAGLLLGADAPQIMNVPGFSVHQELAWLVAAGLTPLQALQSATVNVARFFAWPDAACVKAGCRADLVLLEHNPLLDIRHSAGVQGVARSGRWYDRQELDRRLRRVAERGL